MACTFPKKNILIFIFIILGMIFVLSFNDHNFKRAVDACLAGSQKLSESKITDLEEARKFCEDQIKKNIAKKELKSERRKIWQERFQWFIFAALICLMIETCLTEKKPMENP